MMMMMMMMERRRGDDRVGRWSSVLTKRSSLLR